MTESEIIPLIVILIIVLLIVSIDFNFDNCIMKQIKKCIYYLQCFYDDFLSNQEIVCFPSGTIPVYEKVKECTCDNSKDPIPNPSQNIINVNCGGGNKCSSNSCDSICKGDRDISNDFCKPETEVIFNCYKYVLSFLPGIIYKYKIISGSIDTQSKQSISHNLGSLRRIYIDNNNLYVEDYNSNIYLASFNTDGTLSF